MPRTRSLPSVVLSPGDGVELTDAAGRHGVRATVLSNGDERIALRLAGLFDSRSSAVRLHRLDGVHSWQAEGVGVQNGDPLTLDVELVDGWTQSGGRAAARFPADRRLVRVREANHPIAHDLVAVDVSATGCCLSGSGRPPRVGTRVLADISASSYLPPTRLHANVVRAYSSAFGRFELGLRFEPQTPSERSLILTWRDETASASAGLPLELVAD